MITNTGKDVIRQFFGGQIAQIGGTLGFGVGIAPATLADVALDYEVARVPVVTVNGDLLNSRTVYAGRLEPGVIRRIYEIALYVTTTITTQSYMLNLFGTNGGTWSNGVLDPTFARANENALRIEFLADGSTTSEITGLNDDLSIFADDDSLIIGVHSTVVAESLTLRLGTDDANYFEYVFTGIDAGYNVLKAVRSTATLTGTPTWGAIQYVALVATAAATPGAFHIDGLRFEEQATGQLVSRTVLDEPIEVDPDIPSDVEYALGIAFT